jgi:hypothetical protein
VGAFSDKKRTGCGVTLAYPAGMSLRTSLDFLLHDRVRVDELASRPCFADHSRETFDAVLDTCERIARKKYASFNRLVDTDYELARIDAWLQVVASRDATCSQVPEEAF